MRTLVVSDIHGNLAALEAVLAEPHDSIVCLGDIVGYGPEPAACLERIRCEAEVVVQGNHDRALGEGVAPRCRAQFRRLAQDMEPIGRAQIDRTGRAYLAGLPRWALLYLSGVRYMFVHATPRDPLYRYLGADAGSWAEEVAGVDAHVIVVGHTHLQFDLAAGERRVVNPGSVGQPKDADPRAAYAVIEDGVLALRRTAYPIERTIDALEASGSPNMTVTQLAALLRSGSVDLSA